MTVKKVLGWGVVAFLVFYIAYRPTEAAGVFRSLGSSLGDIANGVGAFLAGLVK